jgi:hypothetical protein
MVEVAEAQVSATSIVLFSNDNLSGPAHEPQWQLCSPSSCRAKLRLSFEDRNNKWALSQKKKLSNEKEQPLSLARVWLVVRWHFKKRGVLKGTPILVRRQRAFTTCVPSARCGM